MTELATRLRTLVLQLFVSVLVLHGAAIAIYLLTPVRHSTGAPRNAFLAIWTAATLVVVLSGLHRLRAARAAARRSSVRAASDRP